MVVDLVHKVGPESNVHDAVVLMLEKVVGCLVVSGSGGPVGIITQEDILRKVTSKGAVPKKVRV